MKIRKLLMFCFHTETFLRTSCIDRFSPFSLATREGKSMRKCSVVVKVNVAHCLCVGVRNVASSAREKSNINTNLQTITTVGSERNLWGWNVCRLNCVWDWSCSVIFYSNKSTSRWTKKEHSCRSKRCERSLWELCYEILLFCMSSTVNTMRRTKILRTLIFPP